MRIKIVHEEPIIFNFQYAQTLPRDQKAQQVLMGPGLSAEQYCRTIYSCESGG